MYNDNKQYQCVEKAEIPCFKRVDWVNPVRCTCVK